jgi:uncharacterized protein YjbI with pentapeptide repeats
MTLENDLRLRYASMTPESERPVYEKLVLASAAVRLAAVAFGVAVAVAATVAATTSRQATLLEYVVVGISASMGTLFLLGYILRGTAPYRHNRADGAIGQLDLYTSAVQQLAAKDSATRVGGVYALELLATAGRPADSLPVMRVLEAFVRETAPKTDVRDGSRAYFPDTAMQAALTALGRILRRTWPGSAPRLDLSGLVLDGVRLPRGCLMGAKLSNCSLIGADFSFAQLDYADLTGADLSASRLAGASLRGAVCKEAKFNSSLAMSCSFHSSLLTSASLDSIVATEADFRSAILVSADLRGGEFTGARFEGALLAGALYNASELARANVAGADFSRVDDQLSPGSDLVPEPRPATRESSRDIVLSDDDDDARSG